ncbi:hypothetical protein SAMN05661010_01694 [Modicisalibacter muralis]|uniref:Uncharacterized protein n=1 Tax=Modicisalibacter muralis TaxID=119000 RepID=A0A1G9K1B8_9GAMM|nr:hypothetical protein [Halomonas muralis]SDL43115.1 hypothetical protein SAMN05661010_01694 [Halomonas muralis]
MSTMQRFSVFLVVALLTGCQGLGGQDPLGRSPEPLPRECEWPRDGDVSREDWLRATIAALEARGFTIRNTEVELGVVSAERTTRLPGLGAVDRPWFGFSSLWGGFGSGSGVGLGFGTHFGGDPMQVERLSVVSSDTTVRVTRDSSVIDPSGYVVDARADNHGDFCRELNESIAAHLRTGVGREGNP